MHNYIVHGCTCTYVCTLICTNAINNLCDTIAYRKVEFIGEYKNNVDENELFDEIMVSVDACEVL